MTQTLGYAAAHDTSIEDRYTPAPVLAGKVVVISGIGPGLGLGLDQVRRQSNSGRSPA